MQTGRTNQSYESEGVAYVCYYLSEFVQVVAVLLELSHLLHLPVDVLSPLIRVKPSILILLSELFEPLSVPTQQIVDFLLEEELVKGSDVTA